MASKHSDGLALVFGKPHDEPDGDEPEMDEDGDDASGGLEAACSEMLEHLGIALPPEKERAFCDALKNFVKLAAEEPDEEPEMGEGEESGPELPEE